MNELIQIFIDHIPYDKEFIDQLLPKYEHEFELLGGFIKKHSKELWCQNNLAMQELLDFLDGNGFEVIRPINPIPYDTHPIELIPIYTEKTTLEEEIKEANERLKAAVQKIQSTLSEYVPVQETVLSYTSMEDNKRYILEYEKLLASWAFWLRVCRRVELLRLVPKGRCGSSPVPRPPQPWLSWLSSLGSTREMARTSK